MLLNFLLTNLTMDKKEMLRLLLKSGVLLSPELVENLNEDRMRQLLHSAGQSDEIVFTKTDESAPSARVTKTKTKNKLGVQDFTDYYKTRYNTIKEMLSAKLNAVSINNAKSAFSEISVIGMVRELTPSGMILEDPTGEIPVILQGENTNHVAVDDVIGLTGSVKEGKMFAREVVLPDVPLSNKPERIDINIILTAQLTQEIEAMGSVGFIITPATPSKKSRRIITCPHNPCWIGISKKTTKINILFYSPTEDATPEKAISWLRKRHLSPNKNEIRPPNDPHLINPIPTVFWLLQKNTWNENYKGVNIISCDRETTALVNLWSHETKFQKIR